MDEAITLILAATYQGKDAAFKQCLQKWSSWSSSSCHGRIMNTRAKALYMIIDRLLDPLEDSGTVSRTVYALLCLTAVLLQDLTSLLSAS